jgi:hypothetical protein
MALPQSLVPELSNCVNMARQYASKVSRQVTWGVSALVAAAVLGVGLASYIAVARTAVIVTVKPIDQAAEFSLTVKPEGATLGEGEIAASFAETTVTGSATQQTVGEKKEIPGKARGQVTITNTWSQDQPLAATTRLLSAEGILFRTTARVDVPARGSVVANVEADQAGAQGDIGPSTFSIPGLSTDLQQRIQGKSEAAMTGGVTEAGVVTETDLEASRAAATADAEAKLSSWAPAIPSDYVFIEGLRPAATIISEKLNAKAGDQIGSITATTTLRLRRLAFRAEDIHQRARRELSATLGPGLTLTDQPLVYRLVDQQLTLDNGVLQGATLRVKATGVAEPAPNNPIFATTNLTSRTAAEITAVLKTAEFVESVETRFAPFWSRQSSRLPDHIDVTILDNSS